MIMTIIIIAAFLAAGVLFVTMEQSEKRPLQILGKVLSKVLVAIVAVPFVLAVVVGCLCIVLNLLGIL